VKRIIALFTLHITHHALRIFLACSFSFIIPVLNEAERINTLIEVLYRRFPDDSFEILVVDGDPDGSTLQVIQHSDVIKLCSPPGRGVQMNTGADAAQGKILIFLHADTELPPGALCHIREIMAGGHYAAGAFTLRFDSDRWAFRLIEIAASWRYRLTRYPYGDQAIFMTKAYFERLGGYAEIPIMEDLELMRRIKRRGDKIYISKERVQTSARRWEKEGVIYSILRTWILASLYCLGVSADTLADYYRHYRKYE
jgi:rSAM/selenodomain-associated transferase 2